MKEYVVYVTFPGNPKEYVYLCNIPDISQGDEVIANGTRVLVRRTADKDFRANKYVHPIPNYMAVSACTRKSEIMCRLREIEREDDEMKAWAALAKRNTEAKKLLAELKKL